MVERVRLARLLAGEGFGFLRRGLGRPMGLAAALRARAPDRLLIAPQDIRTADPTVAVDIYAGYFSFAGKMLNTHGQSPFALPPPSPAWAAQLAGFGWLRHLRAADTALARANARALVEDWMSLCGRPREDGGWEPRVVARRLLSWLSQSPLILEGADRSFYRRFMKSIGRQAAILQRAIRDGLAGDARLLVAITLAELGLCAEGMGGLQRRATRLLNEELSRQILMDGGHIGRHPQTLVDLLLDLLPLRQAYSARGLDTPPTLLNAIDRITPMLRLFRLGDGSMALFNGMGSTAPHALATVLAYDDSRAAPLTNAPYSGYQRIEMGGTILVMDTGVPPPPEFSDRAHAGCLSFEFSSDGQRVVVNCGSPDESRQSLREAARSTAAHSTLIVSDTSSCHFATGSGLNRWLEGRIVSGPTKVPVNRTTQEEAIRLDSSHDGYERRFGILHARAVTLCVEGARIEGEDSLTNSDRRVPGMGTADFAVRFHLHPAVQPSLIEDNRAVRLLLPNGQFWIFRAEGLPLALEESIYLAGADGIHGTEQIAVHANLRDTRTIYWSFDKVTAADLHGGCPP